jgi:hypothetical protein
MQIRPLILGLSVLTALSTCLVPSGVSAQVLPNGTLTPQQQQALYLRSLQMRGGGQIRTGYPQNIQMGPQAGGFVQSEQPQDTTQKSSTQKRIEARKARDEQKRAARDEAQAKKAKAVKKPIKEAPAKAAKKPAKEVAAKAGKQPKKGEDAKAGK